MFTIKYVDGDGVENISNAEYVVADTFHELEDSDGRPVGPAKRRVMVFDEMPTVSGDNNNGVYCDNGCRSINGIGGGPVVYVMNRYGSTVAQYKL